VSDLKKLVLEHIKTSNRPTDEFMIAEKLGIHVTEIRAVLWELHSKKKVKRREIWSIVREV
jgi:transcription initiation factor IIE alpha subunit